MNTSTHSQFYICVSLNIEKSLYLDLSKKCKVAKRPIFCQSIVEKQYEKPWSEYAHISSQ
jgi:hypothetical protein